MRCDRIEAMLPDHAVGRLSGLKSSEVESHLANCTACHNYLGSIQALYDIPLPYEPAPPTELDFVAGSSSRAGVWRIAVGLIALAAALLLYFKPTGEAVQSDPTATRRVQASLASLSITLPELPVGNSEQDWIQSESEARLLSEYSGKPVLMQYINAECQRCLGVVKLMDDPGFEPLLEEFICFRSAVEQDAPPAVLAGHAPEGELMNSLPAMFVQAEGCSTDPSMAISNWDDVEDVVADYATNCELRGIEIVRALEGQEFDAALAEMRTLPKLMEAGSYNEVLAKLQSMTGLGKSYRTRFALEAERMENELMEELEQVVCKLEALQEDDAQALAQDLLPGLADTPFASRVGVLCN